MSKLFLVNGINIPLYFKFSTILAKENLSADKLLTLENWMQIFDELNPLLASDPSTLRKSKTFEMDSGRLSVKARWVKISDSSDVGAHIVKILNLSSSGVGKYFLKIDVKLSSYLERIASELEQKSKSLDIKETSKEAGHDRLNNLKHKKSNNRKISDMLPKIKKEKDDPPAVLDDTAILYNLEEPNADDLNKVEEYIPLPKPTASDTAFTTTDTVPTYTPEKCVPTELNVHSEYSPTLLQAEKSPHESDLYDPTAASPPITATYNPEKKLSQNVMNKLESEYLPTCRIDTPIKEELVYKPTSKRNKPFDNEKTTTILNKSKELFGSSDEASNDEKERVSSSSHRIKRKMDLSPRREKTSSKGKDREKTKSKKKKVHDEVKQECKTEDGDISIRNLMTDPLDAVLETYPEHEPYLTGLYKTHVKELKRSYRPIDFPDMLALDIVSTPQFTAMVDFLEKTLVRNAEEEHNYSDIIFDLLIPEWALAIFCKRFHCTRSEALERLRLQTVVLSQNSQL
ncbi:uncharacterized protein LOC119085657 isoform X2 [Bradysia coprophila]|uniref:uncharacterized protein LOC119085657 isoform X2 n=1 Tax=Bradysia coprophila TaxID=38358 RepID=UPI00187DCAE5|nr:uncharacterized protein LOC119085657 isoform X2 [Bradysia coprophila]